MSEITCAETFRMKKKVFPTTLKGWSEDELFIIGLKKSLLIGIFFVSYEKGINAQFYALHLISF